MKQGDQACGKKRRVCGLTGWSCSLTNVFLFKLAGHMALLDTMSMYIPRSHWMFEGLAKGEKRRTLTNVVLPVPPSPTANARE